jgi:hypothetical protein
MRTRLLDRLQGALDGFKAGRSATVQTSAQQAAWNQNVANARQQEQTRQVYLEKECNALREMAKDITRAYLRITKNVRTNDGSYPSDRQLGFDGYGTTVTLATAEVALQKRLGQQRKPSWRDRLTAKYHGPNDPLPIPECLVTAIDPDTGPNKGFR